MSSASRHGPFSIGPKLSKVWMIPPSLFSWSAEAIQSVLIPMNVPVSMTRRGRMFLTSEWTSRPASGLREAGKLSGLLYISLSTVSHLQFGLSR